MASSSLVHFIDFSATLSQPLSLVRSKQPFVISWATSSSKPQGGPIHTLCVLFLCKQGFQFMIYFIKDKLINRVVIIDQLHRPGHISPVAWS